jgi:hypothetical protein
MAHFAKLDENNIVVFVTVGRQEDDGKETELTERTGDVYKQTSYNTRGGVYYNPETNEPAEDQSKAFRKNYAGLGYNYDAQRDAFIPPKPFESWILNEETCLWNAPIAMPSDGEFYSWNETVGNWEKM